MAQAFARLAADGLEPRGAAFWNILDEGAISVRDRRTEERERDAAAVAKEDESKGLGAGGTFRMAMGLNKFLNTRGMSRRASNKAEL